MQIRRAIIVFLLGLSLAVDLPANIPDAVGRRGMVVSANLMASRLGLNILRRGGNAIDAAVATGFGLAVTEPRAGNIGGGGFMVIRLADGTTTTIDFREKAPAAAHGDMYLDENGQVIADLSTEGILAAGVPGTVAGYGLALRKYGKMSWGTVVTLAADLAESGFAVSYQLNRDLVAHEQFLTRFESTREIFYPRERPLRLNALFKQPDLAATLRRIAAQGAGEFYTGRTAQLIAAHMERTGGLVTLADLADYRAIERPPIEFDYRDVHIISMGPPSSGGILLAEILNQMELVDFSEMEFHSAEHIHTFVEASRRAFADRAHFLGDPDFVDIPVEGLISDAYAARRWQDFSPRWATGSDETAHGAIIFALESEETTHFSVVDRWGNAVAVTTTINGLYGCGEVVQGAGFLLNNEMDDFALKPGHPNMFGLTGSRANAIEPGKRMLSSMTPTIVTRDGSLLLIAGSPGGSKIITTVAQVISNVVDFGLPIKNAVEAPRFHHQWLPDVIISEPLGISAETRQRLNRMGHRVDYLDGYIGSAHCIMVDPVTGWNFGAADSRRESGAAGY
ncbi:MAG: gamma-glutamyltransferase [Candidatus Marinimicrobia bacterium]|nr:gamma-glutamyltransferase [Candidatus Neomarinimicrobiota bacterium]